MIPSEDKIFIGEVLQCLRGKKYSLWSMRNFWDDSKSLIYHWLPFGLTASFSEIMEIKKKSIKKVCEKCKHKTCKKRRDIIRSAETITDIIEDLIKKP